MKRFFALLCSIAMLCCLFSTTALATGGNGNIDGGGGDMGQGTSSNFWTPGNDGVRITVVDAQTLPDYRQTVSQRAGSSAYLQKFCVCPCQCA